MKNTQIKKINSLTQNNVDLDNKVYNGKREKRLLDTIKLL